MAQNPSELLAAIRDKLEDLPERLAAALKDVRKEDLAAMPTGRISDLDVAAPKMPATARTKEAGEHKIEPYVFDKRIKGLSRTWKLIQSFGKPWADQRFKDLTPDRPIEQPKPWVDQRFKDLTPSVPKFADQSFKDLTPDRPVAKPWVDQRFKDLTPDRPMVHSERLSLQASAGAGVEKESTKIQRNILKAIQELVKVTQQAARGSQASSAGRVPGQAQWRASRVFVGGMDATADDYDGAASASPSVTISRRSGVGGASSARGNLPSFARPPRRAA